MKPEQEDSESQTQRTLNAVEGKVVLTLQSYIASLEAE
jgi:hypothetical protein